MRRKQICVGVLHCGIRMETDGLQEENGHFRISKPENDAKIRHVGSNLIWKMGFLTGITDLTAEILI